MKVLQQEALTHPRPNKASTPALVLAVAVAGPCDDNYDVGADTAAAAPLPCIHIVHRVL